MTANVCFIQFQGQKHSFRQTKNYTIGKKSIVVKQANHSRNHYFI